MTLNDVVNELRRMWRVITDMQRMFRNINGNVDGGDPDTIYGGTTPIDGGDIDSP